MARDLLPQPSILADMFAKVPQIADLVVKDLDPDDTVNLMMKTDPALTSFCQVEGGGLDRFLKISQEGKYERRLLRRMPSIPRLLAKEWREKLLGKRLIAENAQTDDTTFKRSDIPEPNRIGHTCNDCAFRKNRLNVKLDDGKVTQVYYG